MTQVVSIMVADQKFMDLHFAGFVALQFFCQISMWFICILLFLNLAIGLFPDTNESTTTDSKNRFRPDLQKLNVSLLFARN